MLNIDIDVVRGITFVRVEGDLNNNTFDEFDLKINNLIYKFGMQFFVFNFVDVIDMENSIFNKIQNKLYEIFLSCGDVLMCGVKGNFKDKRCIYINSEVEAFKYFKI